MYWRRHTGAVKRLSNGKVLVGGDDQRLLYVEPFDPREQVVECLRVHR